MHRDAMDKMDDFFGEEWEGWYMNRHLAQPECFGPSGRMVSLSEFE